MADLKLANGMIVLLDDEDFHIISSFIWLAHRGRNTWYAERHRPDRKYMHTIITGWKLVDHINRNGLDNRRCNLRQVTHLENCVNSGSKGGTSKYKGVFFEKRRLKWTAVITFQRKQRYIGAFNSEEDAAKAYDVKALELFGSTAYQNFPS